jgi:2-polyprenyl-6-methoxyphenol hydroxylase-like FAD-dependent oxidoreductase
MKQHVLICGASFAGLSTAFWMQRLGHDVTIIDIAAGLRAGGTPIDIKDNTVGIAKRMGILGQIEAERLNARAWEFKNALDVTEGRMGRQEGEPRAESDIEIERFQLLNILCDQIQDRVAFRFSASIIAMAETKGGMRVTFKDGSEADFGLVFGCDGLHSAVRRLWFGPETEFMHFLGQYFSITIVDKLLIPLDTTQMFNMPDKGVMLTAYKGRTDIVLCFRSETEIPYDYRDERQQRQIIRDEFAGEGWRIPELLREVEASGTFYFDKLCQIKMPSWTKGRVALVGDAGYCASPAAGMGGSLAIDGAAALAEAFAASGGDFAAAFRAYDQNFRPFIAKIQTEAEGRLDLLLPRTEESIRLRNTQADSF